MASDYVTQKQLLAHPYLAITGTTFLHMCFFTSSASKQQNYMLEQIELPPSISIGTQYSYSMTNSYRQSRKKARRAAT